MSALHGFEPVARAAEVPEGAPRGVTAPGGARLCLVRVGGAIHALADGCTHQEFPLSAGDVAADGTIECPWHGARFDCRTGAVLRGPACDAVKVHEVRVEDGIVYVRDEGSGKREEVNATLSREEV